MPRTHQKTSQKTSKPALRIFMILAGLAVVGLLGLAFIRMAFPATYLALKNMARQFSYQFRGITVGSEAPDFTASTLEGQAYTLSQFRGQPVIISFGASWCPDCRKQAPLLNTVHRKYPNLVILEIDVNEPEAVIRQFIADFGMEYPVLTDPGRQIYQQYQNFGIPATFFIDAEGVIRARMIAFVTDDNLLAGLAAIGIEE